MLERAVQLRPAIEAAFNEDVKTRGMIPSEEEWSIARDLVKILKPFQEATKVLSGSKYVTISAVYPIYRRLHEIVIKQQSRYTEGTPIRKLLDLLRRNVKNLVLSCDDFYRKASILDPRFLNLWRSTDTPDAERQHLLHELRKELSVEERKRNEAEQKERGEDKRPERERPAAVPAAAEDDDFVLFPHVDAPEAPNAKDEVTRYFEEQAIKMEDDPFTHWFNNLAPKYPLLARIARRYFCVVASSVPSERLFSQAGQVITDQRASLNPEMAEQQIFVLQNRELVGAFV